MARPDVLNSFEREAWVIPNGHGELWSDRIFESEAEAWRYLKNWWDRLTTPDGLQPVRARVRVTAEIIAQEDQPALIAAEDQASAIPAQAAGGGDA